MIPRRGSRKVGLKRIDAAIDALLPYGFSKSVIRKHVNQLLKVYGGEWNFIEEASYTLLIETILQEQSEQESHDAQNQDHDNSVDDHDEVPTMTTEADMGDRMHEADKPAEHSVRGDDHWAAPERNQIIEYKGESSGSKDKNYRREPCYGWISDDDFDDMFDDEERAANRV